LTKNKISFVNKILKSGTRNIPAKHLKLKYKFVNAKIAWQFVSSM